MSVLSKWINAINTIATGSKRIRNILTPFGVFFFLSACSGLIFLSIHLDKIFGFQGFIPYTAGIIAGLIVLVPGTALTITCVIFFLQSRGTPLPLNPPEDLIKKGPYSVSRNPMMAGLMLQFFGIGIFMNSITLTFITSPLLTIIMTAELKLIEEPELIKRFGSNYLEYMKEVPMFIPLFRRKKNTGKG